MHDIVIIGAGPAGLTAAIYARRAGKSVLVLEAKSFGGQIINTPEIENYPAAPHISGFDFASNIYSQATELGAEVRFEKAVEIITDGEKKTVRTVKNEYGCRAVIIASGSENRKLGLEGEDALLGRGVSYCATCDGNFFRGKRVIVVGGGNTALEDALYLSDLCETVFLVHRRDSFRGEEATAARLKTRENVVFKLEAKVTKLLYSERLEGAEITRNSGETETLAASGLFVAVGRVPESRNFAPLLDLDDSGYAAAGEDCRTKTPGVFVAGDARAKALRQLVTAVSDGASAATNAAEYLNNL
ncbi:MAG: FAD-dependent oxidoreductase [Clostridia bacterium]|nr:FAD-dependent oxidoreductase [Clostridia bacterium]